MIKLICLLIQSVYCAYSEDKMDFNVLDVRYELSKIYKSLLNAIELYQKDFLKIHKALIKTNSDKTINKDLITLNKGVNLHVDNIIVECDYAVDIFNSYIAEDTYVYKNKCDALMINLIRIFNKVYSNLIIIQKALKLYKNKVIELKERCEEMGDAIKTLQLYLIFIDLICIRIDNTCSKVEKIKSDTKN